MDNLPRVTTFVKWRQIDGFPDYSVSNTGLAKFKHTIMTLQLRTGRKDYYYIIVRNTTAKKFARLDVHRLVWDYFGSEPFKKGYEVHHKDENPNNNHIDNLELLLLAVHRKLHAKSHCKGYKKQIL